METLLVFFENIGIRQMVHTNFSQEIANHGDTVNTRIPEIMTAKAVGSRGQVTTIDEPQATNVQVVLDQNQEVTFELRDRTRTTSFKNLQEEFMDPAAKGLIRAIEEDGLSKMADTTNGFDNATAIQIEPVTGGVGDTPATYTLELIAQAARDLDINLVPDDSQRWHAITPKQLYDMTISTGPDAALMLDASKLGGESFLRERRLGRLFGINVEMMQGVTTLNLAAASPSAYPDAPVEVAPFWWKNSVAYVNRALEQVPSGQGVQMSVQSFHDQSVRVTIGYSLMDKRQEISIDLLWGWSVMRQTGGGVIKTAA
jgi:hypothetical protein